MLLRLYVLFLYVVYNINVSPAFRRDIYFAAVRSKFGMTTLNYWIILKIPSGFRRKLIRVVDVSSSSNDHLRTENRMNEPI